MSSGPMVEARRRDSEAKRQRVLDVLEEERRPRKRRTAPVTVVEVAHRAGVDPSFFYREYHRDLLAAVRALQAEPQPARDGLGGPSRASLLADNAHLRAQARRLADENAALKRQLSGRLGRRVVQEAGLDGPEARLRAELDAERNRSVDLARQLEERGEELAAAHEANRRQFLEFNRAKSA